MIAVPHEESGRIDLPGPSGYFVGREHRFPVRVYFEDTDAGGIVYYANYLKFAERARTEMMRCLGFASGHLLRADGRAVAVRRCTMDLRRPARLDDLLEVRTRVTTLKGASLALEQAVCPAVTDRNEGPEPGDPLAVIAPVLACMDAAGRAVRLPEAFRAALGHLAARPDSTTQQTTDGIGR